MAKKLHSKLEAPCGRACETELEIGHKTIGIITKNRERLETYIKERKLNSSDIRDAILDIVCKEKRHFSVQNLVAQVRLKHSDFGSATVYRNVAVFLEAQVIIEAFTNSKGVTFYEINRDIEHDHVQCLDCNKIFEFKNLNFEIEAEKSISNLSFTSPIAKNVFYAKCKLLDSNKLKGKEITP